MSITFKQFVNVSDGLHYHIEHAIPLCENIYRMYSEEYFQLYREARQLFNEQKIELNPIDKILITETDIGEFDVYSGNIVPLDCPLVESINDNKKIELNKPKRGGPKKYYVYVKDPKTGNIKKVTFGDKGGSSTGATLSVKFNDPEARASFSARHKCDMQKDKTSAAYWSCRLPRYAAMLGLSGGGNFYW